MEYAQHFAQLCAEHNARVGAGMSDDAYDALEALGEARELEGEPEPWDDEYWEGVLTDA